MLRWRFTIDAHPRWKNGQPPHSTTGVASASSIQFSAAPAASTMQRLARAETPHTMNARIGAVSASDHRNRRVMSSSSGLVLLERHGYRLERHPADRARPGPFWRISGCIGHVYSAEGSAPALSVRPGWRSSSDLRGIDRDSSGCRNGPSVPGSRRARLRLRDRSSFRRLGRAPPARPQASGADAVAVL